MIEGLYPYLILAGCTIGAVLAVLSYQARKYSRINLALIRLNEQLAFDTPDFLRDAWPLLSRAGMAGIAWELDWFGQPVKGSAGAMQGDATRRVLRVAEIRLDVVLYLERRRGERRYFAEGLVETFMLLLRTDMLIKANAVDATFAQMARLNLFLQHDIKNIAQFIQLMADQLAQVPPGKEAQVLDYLGNAAPLLRERADRVVRTLTSGQGEDGKVRYLDVAVELERMCRLHRLAHRITGGARAWIDSAVLDTALDNILKNYADAGLREGRTPVVAIHVGQGGKAVTVNVSADDPQPAGVVERLFEPFWSSHPSGLGVGLYQARQALESCGGALAAERGESGRLCFAVTLPVAAALSHAAHM
ncbi:MAG TPA: HAMP domain-containing sensor histidine kinase [Noviherbaspirillum sp.]|jgi:signal transduction histidine kinase|uniref:sensor histidine kinase n=1 Tax=Noviherbaspirillum sp. TaxID=1926288 RepID=UPI002F942634